MAYTDTGIYIDGDLIISIHDLRTLINAASDTGVSGDSYSSRSQALLNSELVTPDVGVIAKIYDPGFAAMLAGEI